MSAADPGPAHEARLEAAGADHPGVAPGAIDLVALEQTRQGLKLAAPGVLLVLLAVPWVVVTPLLSWPLLALRFTGWLLLGLGLAMTAPTPDGPLPRWLKVPYVALCLLAAVRVLLHALGMPAALRAAEPPLVGAIQLAFLGLPWILWRFCQDRGLTGRALTWLWSALALLAVFGLTFLLRSAWTLWLAPALGLLLFVACRQTARDVWLDAVQKASRRAARGTGAG